MLSSSSHCLCLSLIIQLTLHACQAGVFLRWRTSSTADCTAFRETDGCSGDGSRIPAGDRSCSTEIPCEVGLCPSGYCECANGIIKHKVDCRPSSHSSFKCEDYCTGTTRLLEIGNGYVSTFINVDDPQIDQIFADYSGNLDTTNVTNLSPVLSSGLQLQTVDAFGVVKSNPAPANLTILVNTTAVASILLANIVDDKFNPLVVETWILTLKEAERYINFTTYGSTTRQSVPSPGSMVELQTNSASKVASRAFNHSYRTEWLARHTVEFNALSIYAKFDEGMVQMKNANTAASFFCGTGTLKSLYGLGGGTAFDIRRAVTGTAIEQVALTSNAAGSGLHTVLIGRYNGDVDVWTHEGRPILRTVKNHSAMQSLGKEGEYIGNDSWTTEMLLAPNNFNFPSFDISPTIDNLPQNDLEALMTGSYGTSPGCLCTYPNEVVPGKQISQIATTIARPDRGYSNTYNYFDPDNYISLTGLMYSGDNYFLEQARQVVERSGSFLKSNGQLPHHFEKDVPTYTALSGATQTGPNTFWTKTALQ